MWLDGSSAFSADLGWMQPLLSPMCWSCVPRKGKEHTWVSSLPLIVAFAVFAPSFSLSVSLHGCFKAAMQCLSALMHSKR